MRGLLIQFGIDMRLTYNILKRYHDVDRLVIDELFPWTKILSHTEFFEGIKSFKDKKPFASYHRILPLFMIMYKNFSEQKDILYNIDEQLTMMDISVFEYDVPKLLEIRAYVEKALTSIDAYDYIGFYTLTRSSLYMTMAMMIIKQKYPDKKIVGGGPWFETERVISDMLIDKGIMDGYLVGDAEGIDIGSIEGRVVNYVNDLNNVSMGEPAIQKIPWNMMDAIFFYATKGCAFNCSFCAQGVDKFRSLRPDVVADHIQYSFNETGINLFFAADNIFYVQDKWLISFRDEIKQRGLLGKIYFELCNIHPRNLIADETLNAIQELNIHPFVGTESFSTSSLDRMNKKTTKEINLQCIEQMKARDIPFTMGRIFQFPGETEDEFQESLDEYLKVFTWNPNSRYLGVFSLFPNTDIFNQPDKYGIEFTYFPESVYNYDPDFSGYLDKVPCSYIDKTDPKCERFLKLNKRIRIINDKICKIFPL